MSDTPAFISFWFFQKLYKTLIQDQYRTAFITPVHHTDQQFFSVVCPVGLLGLHRNIISVSSVICSSISSCIRKSCSSLICNIVPLLQLCQVLAHTRKKLVPSPVLFRSHCHYDSKKLCSTIAAEYLSFSILSKSLIDSRSLSHLTSG